MIKKSTLSAAVVFFTASLSVTSAQVVQWHESFESYTPGELAGQGGGWIISVPSQAIVINDSSAAADGDQFLRVFRDASGGNSSAIRARNAVVREFSQDGTVSWSMINNNPAAEGRMSFRIPVNSGTSNVFQMEIRQDINDFRYQQLGSWVAESFTVPGEWTDWQVDFSTSDPDPANHIAQLTIRRRSDQQVLLALENLSLAQAIAGDWNGVENLYGVDMVSLSGGDLVHDFSFDDFSAIPEPRTWALLSGLAVLGLALCRRRRPRLM